MSGDPAFKASQSLAAFRSACVASLTDSVRGFAAYPKLTATLEDHFRSGRYPAESAPSVVAIGKAALSMCAAAASVIREIRHGVAVVPRGYASTWTGDLPWKQRLQLLEGAHPVSDTTSCTASAAVEDALHPLTDGDSVVVLISGGGSALVGCPVDGLTHDDYKRVLNQLYRSGAPIGEVNLIRQGLSRLAGGGLLARAAPAKVFAYVLSDVPGDRAASVASGPCSVVSPDETTRAESAITPMLGPQIAGLAAERLRDNAKHAESLASLDVIGTNNDLLAGVAGRLEASGIKVVGTRPLIGEAAECGTTEGAGAAKTLGPGEALLFGGECTVTVRGAGRGGRSQEFVLAAAKALSDAGCVAVVASLGTDGYDGPTDAAGASLIAGDRHVRAVADRIADTLRQNDAYTLLKEVGGLVFTGPTHTNVMDVALIARPPHSTRHD